MENYLLPDWKDKTKNEKVLAIISVICASIVLISILISLFSKYNLFYIYYTFIFLFLIVKGIEYWKYNKPIAIIEFICSIIFLVADIVSIIK